MITHTGILHRTLFPSLLWRMPGKKIFLTFDDGPHSIATPVVLDILKKHGVHATFFLSGKNIEGREDIVCRIVNEGHSVGIHAFNHSRRLAFSKKETVTEIKKTEAILSRIVKEKVRLFRPPFGFFLWNTVSAAKELGYCLVMWSCLTGDFRNWTTEKITHVSLNHIANGSILVFHDNDLTQHKIGQILEHVIPEIQKRGFKFGAIR
ncbi:MAG: polysaccharide deacetylase family protein [Bacteroidota bacterium]